MPSKLNRKKANEMFKKKDLGKEHDDEHKIDIDAEHINTMIGGYVN